MTLRRRSLRGFTLIELMIAVAIISVLMLIAIPKFGGIIRRANEAGTKGHLGNIRAAIRLYYMDNEQFYPDYFDAIRQGGTKFLSGSIPLYTGVHAVTEQVDDVGAMDSASDAGRWAYIRTGPDLGFFWIQCTDTDSSGRPWSGY